MDQWTHCNINSWTDNDKIQVFELFFVLYEDPVFICSFLCSLVLVTLVVFVIVESEISHFFTVIQLIVDNHQSPVVSVAGAFLLGNLF